MKFAATLAAALLCSSAASAHFILTYPASRGFNDDAEPTGPCGGFNALSNRTQFPLTNGFVEILSVHPSSTLQINVVLGSNPAAADFTAAASTPANSTSMNHPGHGCFPLNLSSFNGAANNANATIQLIYNGGDGPLYQCADVVLVTSAPGFDQSQCVNNNDATTSSSGVAPAPTGSGAASIPAKSAALVALTFVAAMMSL
ncbi:hypothetical protein EMPS_03953 [Entomortierella parvispora]|uniref:Copper acquisition factor BIM1-like domain-containing protein n=1 Tax=Entomortierella parvispora TaxID=205924 RepID=A0A9P3LV05_9FUNG|nr:hypothetical protein EMPS_03953 [Entomortierella parvispora]